MRDYLVIGTVKGKRGYGVVQAADETGALTQLPTECFTYQRGKNVPEVWPLDCIGVQAYAAKLGIIKLEHGLCAS